MKPNGALTSTMSSPDQWSFSRDRSQGISSSSGPKDSSETTTAPQLSSSCSANCSSQTDIQTLRQQLQLLKLQLKQREKEFEKYNLVTGTEDVRTEKWKKASEMHERRTNALEGMCTNLLSCMEEVEKSEKEKLDSISNMYEKHVEQLARETSSLKQLNATLQRQLADANHKVSTLEANSNFTRWENENCKKEIEALTSRIDCNEHDWVALKSELRLTKRDNDDLRQTHSARLSDEVGNAVSKKMAESESLRRKLKDREREYGINLSRMHNEVQFLKSELLRKERVCKHLTQMLDKLTKDNQRLFNDISASHKTHEEDVNKLNDALMGTERQLSEAQDSERSLKGTVRHLEETLAVDGSRDEVTNVRHMLLISSRQEQLDRANTTIVYLQKQVEDMSEVQRISDHSTAVKALKEKTLRVVKLERDVEQLQSELEKEREQRENSTTLLIEMGRDMRCLLALANGPD